MSRLAVTEAPVYFKTYQRVAFGQLPSFMSFRDLSFPVSAGSALSVLCLLLYSARFIRIETKFNNYEQRLKTVDEQERALASTEEGNH